MKINESVKRQKVVKLSESQIRQTIKKLVKEQALNDGAAFYKKKLDLLERALKILYAAQELENTAPGGDSEELQDVIDQLESITDAIIVML